MTDINVVLPLAACQQKNDSQTGLGRPAPSDALCIRIFDYGSIIHRAKRNSQTDSRLSDKMFETLLLLKANALYKHL